MGACNGCAVAAVEVRNVLLLYASTSVLQGNVERERGLRGALAASTTGRVELYTEYLDVPRFGGDAYARTFATFLREKYATHPPEAIVATDNSALKFVLQHRPMLFPTVPVVHMGVQPTALESLGPLPADVVGVPAVYDFLRTIDLAFRLHPMATRLVLVTGLSESDKIWEARLRSHAARFPTQAKPEFLAGLSTETLRVRLSRLGPDSVVFTPGYTLDAENRAFTPRDAVQGLAAVTAAPIYGPYETFLGTGVVGGYMHNLEAMGQQAGELVNALLAGVSPTSMRLPEGLPIAPKLDWRATQRWHADERAIPSDAVVLFRQPGLLEAHRSEVIIAAIALVLQAGFIVVLLLERRRRRAAEQAELTQRSQLMHASRLTMAGEMTASIAHEINQPLGAILSNADTADVILASADASRPEGQDALRDIVSRIRRDDLRASEVIRRLRSLLARQEVQRERFEINEALSDIESIIEAEARRRRVQVDLQRAPAGLAMIGDRIQIQQVVINLLLNAMDAVDGLPEPRRKITLSVEGRDGRILIAVRDRGPGIAPENLPVLFDSYFTTKASGMGLGLSISRTLVKAHGGRIWAENNAALGATLQVELPAASETPAASQVQR
jgi:signal transduction histidine kinase